MMHDLLRNLKENQNDKTLRVVVLAAEGPVFSAGHNLKELVIFKPNSPHDKEKNKRQSHVVLDGRIWRTKAQTSFSIGH